MKNVRSLTFLAAVAIIAAACSDRSSTSPNNAGAIEAWREAKANVTGPIVPGTCTTLSALYAKADQVFGAGGPNANSVKSKIDQIDKANKKNDRVKANDAAFNAVRFIFQKFKGPQPLAGTPEQVAKLISDIFCYAGINITISDPANSNLIDPSSTTQVVKSSDSTAGTQLPPGSVQEPIVLEFTKVPNSFTTPGAGPLNTKLDQYPGFYLIKAGSASGSGPTGSVVVAICPDASVPASIRGRLRLGHEKTSGFEITPPADASFLTCPAPTSLGLVDRVIDGVMSKLLPKTLYAKLSTQEEAFRGGVGGSATEFSPFDPVDPELVLRGGVGGSATEFKLDPAAPSIPLPFPMGPVKPRTPMTGTQTPSVKGGIGAKGTTLANTVAAPCPVVEGYWDAPLDAACRPGLVIATHLGTPLSGVPVAWARVLGGGAIAAENPADRTCTGAFGTLVNNTTDATGRIGICWNLGVDLGTNTATATPSAGGDAPAGVTFLPAVHTFTATAIKVTPVVATSGPDSVVYNAADQTPFSSTVTDAVHSTSLAPVPVVYGPTTPPRNAGTYTVDASYAGAAKYEPATAPQKTFKITQAVPSVALTCTASQDFTGSDLNPCTTSATGVGGEGPLTPAPVVTYTPSPANAVGHYTAVANFAATQNYFAASSAEKTFKIMGTPTVTISCPASMTYTGAAIQPCTASAINVGSYTVGAHFDGNDLYHPADAAVPGTFSITKAATTTTVNCPATIGFSGAPRTPCTATATGPGGLSQALTGLVYTDNVNPGTASVSAAYAGGANHLASSGTGSFTITAPPATWSLSGPTGATFTSNGSTFMPSFAYNINLGGGGVPTRTWTFFAFASAAGTIERSFSFAGYHAFFSVTAFVRPFVVHNGVKTYIAGAVNQGPVNCCSAPSGGFLYTGGATFTVQQWDTYGFEVGGSNFDSDSRLIGTFTTAPSPLYVNLAYPSTSQNCWHNVSISVVDASTLRWTNSCPPATPNTWLMHATGNPLFYTAGPDYPYYSLPANVGFTLTMLGGVIQTTTGPGGEVYTKVP
jgi:hypothetical protein